MKQTVGISELLETQHRSELKEFALELAARLNPADIAEELENLTEHERAAMFRSLPKDVAADVFSYMPPETQENLISLLTDPELSHIVNDLFLDDAVDFIEEMPANVVKRVLKNASEDTRKQINQLLQYQEDSAGSIMTTEYVDLKENMTVESAFSRIREVGMDRETIYTCYVVDGRRVLDGVITVRALLLAKSGDRVGDLMNRNPMYAATGDDREAVAELFQKYDLIALPVVDTGRHLVGIITVDDVMEVLEEENTEDFYKMAAIVPADEAYLTSGVFELAKNRIFWLMVLMVSAFFTGGIITRYEEILALFPALFAAVPMLMDTGGNAGSQSSTMIIRSLALGELRISDALRILWKEIRVGALVGAALCATNVAFKWMSGVDIRISAAIGASLFVTVVLAKAIGSMLPLLAKAIKVDPALMASPIITTIVDAGGLIVYFRIAKLVMGIK
jgi:magnesium transporter